MAEPAGQVRGPGGSALAVLRIRDFRRLWVGLGLSSLGDWLGLLALTAMASQFAGSYASANYAIAAVLFLRVLPPLVIGPFAGYVADRVDRRATLVWGDVLRAALFASIPVVGTLWWVLVATVLVETVSTVWGPAKDATVPNLVPADRLEAANQVSMTTTYASALPAAALFALLALVDRVAPDVFGWLDRGAEDLALYLNAATFLVSGLVIARLRDIPPGPADTGREAGLVRVVVDGWAYVGRTPLVRGLVVGIVGAFMSGGVVVALARTFVADLRGGDSAYGLLFAAVFLGLALGMWKGPGLIPGVSRRRVFGLALTACGLLLFPVALVPRLEVVVVLAVAVGFCAGGAWVVGNTLLGLEVPDHLRGRTFAFVYSLMRLSLALVLAAAPLLAGAIGVVGVGPPGPDGSRWFSYGGAAVTILAAAVLMTLVGVASYRQMTRADTRKEARR